MYGRSIRQTLTFNTNTVNRMQNMKSKYASAFTVIRLIQW